MVAFQTYTRQLVCRFIIDQRRLVSKLVKRGMQLKNFRRLKDCQHVQVEKIKNLVKLGISYTICILLYLSLHKYDII